ncbi:hypothetical protein N7456_000484 [Penicillium angulare]|uniref:Uncharacterized protein n=1 Tax=Penicillium angulare TaxID=116970 RepID=A0A9W9GCL4_9EURO|nr:hypothetical protein N7456_000484 [Penicillium angulare]
MKIIPGSAEALAAANPAYRDKVRSTCLQIVPEEQGAEEEEEEGRSQAGMSFRWYCPDQVLTVMSQNEPC